MYKPRNLLFGFGLVNATRFFESLFFCLPVSFELSIEMEAPVYSASFGGTCFVGSHEQIKKRKAIKIK
jgi:hypothetical protein